MDAEFNSKNFKKAGTVRTRNIIDLANPAMANARNNSVLNPSAQTTKLCNDICDQDRVQDDYVNYLEDLPAECYVLKMIIEVMQNGGLRVSEALSIKGTDILKSGHIRIKGSKGSDDRIVQVHVTRANYLVFLNQPVKIFDGYSRFWVYREFKKLGIGKRYKGKQKRSVTHYFRQENARLMESSGFDTSIRQKHLGHKSSNSIKHYSNGKK